MRTSIQALLISFTATAAPLLQAATISFEENLPGGYVDVFYNPTAGSEFTNYELLVTPSEGGIRDPLRNILGGNWDDVTDGARYDTWANTPLTSLGAGPPEFYFTEYNPGTPPFTQPTALPRVGSNPDQLNWSVYDTRRGDGPAAEPYHIARIVVFAGSNITIRIQAFDTIKNGFTGGEVATYSAPTFQQFLPEPGSGSLSSLGLLGWFAVARHRRPIRYGGLDNSPWVTRRV